MYYLPGGRAAETVVPALPGHLPSLWWGQAAMPLGALLLYTACTAPLPATTTATHPPACLPLLLLTMLLLPIG